MSNRWLRFVLALIAITTTAAAGFRIFQYEQQLSRETRALAAGTDWADTAVETVGELKAALHAYVAPGQGQAFWTSRAGTLLDKLRSALLELDRSTGSLGTPLTGTLDLSDRLAAAEQRAREYARANQPLLAGDVIFAEARDQLDAIRLQVAAARGQLAQAADARYAAIRRQQTMLAVGAAAITVLALLILVPPVAARGEAAATPAASSVGADPSRLDEYARVVPTPKSTAGATPAAPTPKVTPQSTPIARPAAGAPATTNRPAPRSGVREAIVSAEVMAARSAAGLDPSHRIAENAGTRVMAASVVTARTPPAQLNNAWPEAAALCTDIARVSDSQEVSALLARAATLLNASGIVLWMASEGGHQLSPAASTGYDERLVSRIGAISRDADNLTATAFRDAVARTSAARGDSAAALAAPLLTPAGPVGVLSAELRDVADVDPQRQAIATILSAQLSMLLGTSPSADARKHGTDE